MSDSPSRASAEDEQNQEKTEENAPHENLATVAQQILAGLGQINPEEPTKDTETPTNQEPVETAMEGISIEVKDPEPGTDDSPKLEMSALGDTTATFPAKEEDAAKDEKQIEAKEEEEAREQLAGNIESIADVSLTQNEDQEESSKSTKKRRKKRSKRPANQEETTSEIVSNTDKGFLTEPSACMNTDYETSAPPPRHSTKRGETSAENYNPEKPCAFTEPETLEAMVQCGVDQREMFMPTAAEMSKYPNDPDIRKMVTEHHQKRIERLREMVLQKREEIISRDEQRSFVMDRGVSEEQEEDMDFLKAERRKWEKAQAFQRREAEALVLSALKEEERQKKNEERDRREFERMRKIQEDREKANAEAHKRHQQRLKELEEQDKRRKAAEEEKRREQYEKDQRLLAIQKQKAEEKLRQMKENEKQRQEQAERNRQHIEDIENQRKERIMAREAVVQEREARRLQTLQEETERKAKEQQEHREKKEAQLRQAKQFEKERLEKKRRDGEEKERERERKAQEYRARIQKEQDEYAKKQRMKIERNAQLRQEIDRETMERKRKMCTTDEELNRRLAKIQQDREVQAAKARTGTSDDSMRSVRRYEQYQEAQRLKKQQQDEQLARAEENYQKMRAEQQKQQLMKNIQTRLKQDERDANARHMDNLRKRKIEQIRQKQEQADTRMRQQQLEKERLQKLRLSTVTKMESERAIFEAQFRESMKQNKAGMPLEQLAKKYNLNIEELRERAKRRPVTANTQQNKTQSIEEHSNLPSIAHGPYPSRVPNTSRYQPN